MLNQAKLSQIGVDPEDIPKILALNKKGVGLNVSSSLQDALKEVNLERYQ